MTETNADSGWVIPRVRTVGADAVNAASRVTARSLDDLSFAETCRRTLDHGANLLLRTGEAFTLWHITRDISGMREGTYFALRWHRPSSDYTLSLAGSNGVWQDVGDGKRWTDDRTALAGTEAIVRYMTS